MEIAHFFDSATSTLSYIVFDPKTKDAIVVDPVMDYDPASGQISRTSVDLLISFIEKNQLILHASLETHAHADHITGAQLLKNKYPNIKIGIGRHIVAVQKTFSLVFNIEHVMTDGSQFDFLFLEGLSYDFGSIGVEAIETPGHTPACVAYRIGGNLFTGDAILMPDSGTGRCDFPGGSSKDLYHSIHEKLYKLSDNMRIFVGHDYQPGGRKLEFETSIGKEKAENIQLKEATSAEEYIKFRSDRDMQLSAPRLLLPSIQININAGVLPEPESNGTRYLKMPIVPSAKA